jgi:RNA polymerase sigma factor (TIGR02999 family)
MLRPDAYNRAAPPGDDITLTAHPSSGRREAPPITDLLARWSGGDEAALEQLMPLVYDELRARAAGYLRRERGARTLQPTALVHEAYLRLVGMDDVAWRDRNHFFALAARAMRRVLVDTARRRDAGKRGGDPERVSIERLEPDTGVEGRWLDVLAADRALVRLEAVAPRQARVVEMRFFAGMEEREIADVLGVSLSTVEREWRAARAYLARELARGGAEAGA